MKSASPYRRICGLAGLALAALPNTVWACAACYGQSDSPMAQGMNWGIMTLLVVIGCVLAGIASFFVYLGWRSSDRAPLTSGQSPTSED